VFSGRFALLPEHGALKQWPLADLLTGLQERLEASVVGREDVLKHSLFAEPLVPGKKEAPLQGVCKSGSALCGEERIFCILV
jgi:hypothetical protein